MQSTATADGLGTRDVSALLADTARQVKIMKASWLRVAMNLQTIRAGKLWQHVRPSCENFEDYVFGILKLNRAVVRRMLQAMDYTAERRPSFVEEFQQRGEEMEVPSYDTVNQLRRAAPSFEGREEDFDSLEAKVFDEGVGRVSLKKEIDSMLGDREPADKAPENSSSGTLTELAEIIGRLKELEREMHKLEVSKDARHLMFRLVETLEKEK